VKRYIIFAVLLVLLLGVACHAGVSGRDCTKVVGTYQVNPECGKDNSNTSVTFFSYKLCEGSAHNRTCANDQKCAKMYTVKYAAKGDDPCGVTVSKTVQPVWACGGGKDMPGDLSDWIVEDLVGG